jgi:hypothetical protein
MKIKIISQTFLFHSGSIRTPESICNKIVRILKAYNTAQYRLDTTGAGMVGIEYTNFEEEVIQKHFIYYHELKPILADRPNVTPWATNFDTGSEGDDNIRDDDDESVDSDSCSKNDNSVILIDTEEDFKEDKSMATDTISTKSNSQLTDDNCSSVSRRHNYNQSNDVLVSTVSVSTAGNKRKKQTSKKIAPADAKHTQQSLLRQNKKQICGSNNKSKSKLGALLEAEKEEREFLMELRKTKMDFEMNRHQEMKELEINKHMDMKEIENKKLALQEKLMEVDVEEIF